MKWILYARMSATTISFSINLLVLVILFNHDLIHLPKSHTHAHTHSPTYSHTHSLIQIFTNSLIHLFNPYSLTHSKSHFLLQEEKSFILSLQTLPEPTLRECLLYRSVSALQGWNHVMGDSRDAGWPSSRVVRCFLRGLLSIELNPQTHRSTSGTQV